MKEKRVWTKWLYWFTFAVAVIFVYKTLDNFNDISIGIGKLISILMPFFMGILLAYIFYIPCRQIEKLYKKIKPKFINKRIICNYCVYIRNIDTSNSYKHINSSTF